MRGVVLKNEVLPLHRWLEELSFGLADLAKENEQAHQALSRFVQ